MKKQPQKSNLETALYELIKEELTPQALHYLSDMEWVEDTVIEIARELESLVEEIEDTVDQTHVDKREYELNKSDYDREDFAD